MCEDLTPPGTASGYLLIAPCDGHVLEHIDELVSPDVPGQWSTSASAAAQSVIELLVQTARIVVEREYFDLDFRSEFSLTHETSFAVRSPDTLRLHLFMDEPEAGARLLEAVDQMAASYAGYVILKPQTPCEAFSRTFRRAPTSGETSSPSSFRPVITTGSLFAVRLVRATN